MMMKSEYDRSYQWVPPGGNYYAQNLKGKKLSEPIMTHKRRVKSTEDNVIIGEPLYSQNDDNVKEDPYFVLGDKNKKFHPSIPYRNIKAVDKNRNIENSYIKLEKKTEAFVDKVDNGYDNHRKPHQKKNRFVSEAVQTEKGFVKHSQIINEKSTQISSDVPDAPVKKLEVIRAVQGEIEKPKLRSPVKEAVPPPAGGKSEYQTKYAWVEPIGGGGPEHDKLSQNRHKMDTKLKIYSNFVSEYQRQFRPYEFVTETRYKRMRPGLDHEDTHVQVVPSDRPEMRRRAVTPPPRFVGLAPRTDGGHPAPQDTRNPQRASFPHGKQRRFLTEYSANFDNKWARVEADLAKGLPQDEARRLAHHSRWFKEILDLRKKAQEYRQRARGTHLSREHLGEVFCKSGWRAADDSDEDERLAQSARADGRKSVNGGAVSRTRSAGRRWDEVDGNWDRDEARRHFRRSNSPELAHQGGRDLDERDKSSSSRKRPTRRDSDKNGRNKSPELTQHGRSKKRFSEDDDSFHTTSSICSSSSTIIEQTNTRKSRSPDRKSQNWQDQTAGKPSFDNCLLLDEQASHDTEVKEGFGGPANKSRPANPTPFNTHPDRKYSLQRYFNDQHAGDPRRMRTMDYEAVSNDSFVSRLSSSKSVMSNSSRSLALETLERAKRNRDEILRSKS